MTELSKSYNPKDVEDQWYKTWEQHGFFKPEPAANGTPYCIVIPPPNVTGSLHMGHALNATVQDILVRWKRMSGHRVLWVPGTDHAGIATQNVVERELAKEGLDRYKIGRDEFVRRIWRWKTECGGRIIHQLKKLGASCDWSRERFTLDSGLSRAVKEVFVRLFEEEVIYRDNRLINWCPRCHTALSDLEVEYEEIEGKLYFIRYPRTDGNGFITVATTRPETMLGDTAVAVHPEDDRYISARHKTIDLPLTGRCIPVVVDDSVDPAFGTGAVKVTPAHDFNDETMGRRHNLQFVKVITEDGLMSPEAGYRYAGLDRYQCRKKVIEDLKELNLIEVAKRHVHSVGHCYRCKSIIEPLLTVQWYVKIETLALPAVEAVRDGRIRLVPETWQNNYYGWMRDIRDWCISRQIWWGHQIPVWYCPACKDSSGKHQGEVIEHVFFEPFMLHDGTALSGGTYSELKHKGMRHADILKHSKMIRIPKEVVPVCRREDVHKCPMCGSSDLIRDPDVLDTWFSSALWPFSTLGWPDKTDDLKIFYPTSVLVTAFDILFFWVARMIMMGLKCMDEVPFRDVYIHALVRDLKGKKMSKSKGNVIDPLLMIDRYGADAFRFTLAAFAAQGRDIRFSEDRVEGYRYFINKIWNATKFIGTYRELWTKKPLENFAERLGLSDKWILSRLSVTIEDVNRCLQEYRFNDAASSIYQFAWHEFCDWYIEMTKPILYRQNNAQQAKENVVNCLYFVLEKVLQLLHPFMPFVTEEIWRTACGHDDSIMVSHFPTELVRFEAAEKDMQYVIDAITCIRSIRGELNIPASLELDAFIKTHDRAISVVLRNNLDAIMKLTRSKETTIGRAVMRPKGAAVCVKGDFEIYIPLKGLIDVESEIQRLLKEKAKTDETLVVINRKLKSEDFLKGAPRDVVEKEKVLFDELIRKGEKIEEHIKLLKTV